jgi:hypothetical protein
MDNVASNHFTNKLFVKQFPHLYAQGHFAHTMDLVFKNWLQQEGVVTISHTITSVMLAWFCHVLKS